MPLPSLSISHPGLTKTIGDARLVLDGPADTLAEPVELVRLVELAGPVGLVEPAELVV